MSQNTPLPKEFKFVGGPSRKRRRKTAHGEAANTEKVPASGATVHVACCRDPSNSTQSRLRSTAGPPSTSHAASLTVGDQSAHDAALPSTILTDPAIAGDVLVWLDDGSMNPFFDPALQFANAAGQDGAWSQMQSMVPFYPGADMLFSHLWDSPSTDDAYDQHVGGDVIQASDDTISPEDSPTADSPVEEIGNLTMHERSSLSHPPSTFSYTITQLSYRYDKEFCILPLTDDFEANPFRIDPEVVKGSKLLLHCILALSYKHINRDTGTCYQEAKIHKKKALRMLQGMDKESEKSLSPKSKDEAGLLDAVLILMTLDCATSAHGPWVWYLKNALKMIQASESHNVRRTPRMRARLGMLVWWDVTLALTSRRGCVLSEATALSLFNRSGSDDETFYSVSGCPEDLFKYMIRLGAYAREYELVSTLVCVKFDMEPVLAVEKSIRDWTSPQIHFKRPRPIPGDLLGEEAAVGEEMDAGDLAQYSEDHYHCTEAWRYALLVYIERVFKWRRGEAPSSMLSYLARKTMNHVSSCRRTTMLQKQLLLPVFLAACETTDDFLRDQARSYCTWWSGKTRYDMFLTTAALLEEVWANQMQDPLNNWWGSTINQNTGSDRQYLFG